MLLSNKRGQFIEGLVFTISIFIIAVVFLSYAYIFPHIATSLNQTGSFTTVNEQKAVTNFYDMGTSGISQGFLIFFGGLILVQVASAFFIRYHPVWLIIFFFMIFVNGFLAIYLGNTFDTLMTSPSFATTMGQQPVIEFVFNHFLVIVIAVDILSLFILYAKVGEAPV